MSKNLELYNRTVDILYDAYFNDTLQRGYCSACAVGNIVAANTNRKPDYGSHAFKDGTYAFWSDVFMTGVGQKQLIDLDQYIDEAKCQIDSTGYSWAELALIEHSFETAGRGKNKEDGMYNGLVAVLETLKEIHQITDEDNQVLRFTEHHNKKLCSASF